MVYEAAAKNFCPVILEMGGKSPCIIDDTVNLHTTALRLCQGKWTNAGQTCICPDYVLVHERVADDLVAEVKKVLRSFYGEDAQSSPDLARTINRRAFEKLVKLVEDSKEYIVHGGSNDPDDLYIEPTVMDFGSDIDSFSKAKIMQDEIFGPLMPILRWKNVDEIFRFIRGKEKPLCMYVFSTSKKLTLRAQTELTSGAFVVNETLMHMSNHEIPFGGVGKAGMGNYHGHFTFDAFSHKKAVMHKKLWPDFLLRYFRYPVSGRSEQTRNFIFWMTYIVQYPRYIVSKWVMSAFKLMLWVIFFRFLMSFDVLRSGVRSILQLSVAMLDW